MVLNTLEPGVPMVSSPKAQELGVNGLSSGLSQKAQEAEVLTFDSRRRQVSQLKQIEQICTFSIFHSIQAFSKLGLQS